MTVSAGAGSPHHEEECALPESTGDSVLDPAERSFFLLEPDADAAMTYFYGPLFAMDAEIRAMFPAAMDQQPMRFFPALARISGPDEMIVKTSQAVMGRGAPARLIRYDVAS